MKNPVAKHARTYNKSVVMRDKKKDYTRKGKSKFKNEDKDNFEMLITHTNISKLSELICDDNAAATYYM
jgi:hypothetical protein